VLTAVGLVALILISRYVMQFWVDLYARDYSPALDGPWTYEGPSAAPTPRPWPIAGLDEPGGAAKVRKRAVTTAASFGSG